jgi:hypothetical protein
MNFQSWIPNPLKPLLELLNANPACAGRRRPIFDRLLDDPRMRPVYQEFLRKNRETGAFFHPARSKSSDLSAEHAQVAALGEVLKVTISAASDRISVSKLDQVEEAKRHWSDHAEQLRSLAKDMHIAAALGTLGFDDPLSRGMTLNDAEALRRVASWLDSLRSGARRADDPLIVDRHRGDPIVRGVQILIGVKLEEQFGERLDGTAATLTSVALDTQASPRASRSALTDRPPSKRRSAK